MTKRACILLISGSIFLNAGVSEGWDAEVHKRVTANPINQLRTAGYGSFARYIHENSYPDSFHSDNRWTRTKYPIVRDPRLTGPILPVINERLPEEKRWTIGSENWDQGFVENFVVSANWADVFYCEEKDDCRRWIDKFIPSPWPHHGLFGEWLVGPTEDFFEWGLEEWEAGEKVKALKWIGRACHFFGDATYPGHVPSPFLWHIHRHLSLTAEGAPFTNRTYYPQFGPIPLLNIREQILSYFHCARAMIPYCDGRVPSTTNLWLATEDDVEMVLEAALCLSQQGTASLMFAFLSTVNYMGEPVDVAATTVGEDVIGVAFRDNSTGETGFMIQRATKLVPTPDWTWAWSPEYESGEGTIVSWSDTGTEVQPLRPGTKYYYHVKAENTSEYSLVDSATTLWCNPVADFNVTPISYNKVELTWTDKSRHEEGYLIEPGGITIDTTDAGRGNAVVKSIDLPDFKLDEEQTFTVTTRWLDQGAGVWRESPLSNEVTRVCGGITRLQIQPLEKALHLRWENPVLPFGTKTLVIRSEEPSVDDISWNPEDGDDYPEEYECRDEDAGNEWLTVVYNGDARELVDNDFGEGLTNHSYQYKVFSYSYCDDELVYAPNQAVELDGMPSDLVQYVRNPAEGLGYNNGHSMVVTADNTVCLAYAGLSEPGSSADTWIWYVEYADGDGEWSDPVHISAWASEDNPASPAIAVTPDGQRCVVWADGPSNGALMFNYTDPSGDWQEEAIVLFELPESYVAVENPSIAVDGTGIIHVVFTEIQEESGEIRAGCVYYTQFTLSGIPPDKFLQLLGYWDSPVATVEVNSYEDPLVVLAAFGGQAGNQYYWFLERGPWDKEENWLRGDVPVKANSSLLSDGTDFHIVGRSPASDNVVSFATFDGVNWSSPEDLAGYDGPSRYPMIAASGGDLYVTWQDTEEEKHLIVCRRNHGGEWEDAFLLARTPATKDFPDIGFVDGKLCAIWVYEGNYLLFWKTMLLISRSHCRPPTMTSMRNGEVTGTCPFGMR